MSEPKAKRTGFHKMTDAERREAFDQLVASTPQWIKEQWQRMLSEEGGEWLPAHMERERRAFRQATPEEQEEAYMREYRNTFVLTLGRAYGALNDQNLVVTTGGNGEPVA
jgi:hypothetical protein